MMRRLTSLVSVAPRTTILRHFSLRCGATPIATTHATFGFMQQRRLFSDDEYTFDPSAALGSEAAMESRRAQLGDNALEKLVLSILPPNAPQDAVGKLMHHFTTHSINEHILSPRVKITNVQTETGSEERVSMAEMSVEEAIEFAKEKGMDLVQMGNTSTSGVAFCRVRDEKKRALQLVASSLSKAGLAGAAPSEAEPEEALLPAERLKEAELIQFRDVADAHFIGWKSKKIVESLAKRTPQKLVIREFQNHQTAVSKMQQMLNAIAQHAAATDVSHFFQSAKAKDREISIVLTPARKTKSGNVAVRHPTEDDWVRIAKQFAVALERSEITGTYTKKKPGKVKLTGQVDVKGDNIAGHKEDRRRAREAVRLDINQQRKDALARGEQTVFTGVSRQQRPSGAKHDVVEQHRNKVQAERSRLGL